MRKKQEIIFITDLKVYEVLEGEMKTQKSDMKMAVKTIDKVARAQEDMAKRVPMLSGK